MKSEYDFSNARKNPYASQLIKQITIRLDQDSRRQTISMRALLLLLSSKIFSHRKP